MNKKIIKIIKKILIKQNFKIKYFLKFIPNYRNLMQKRKKIKLKNNINQIQKKFKNQYMQNKDHLQIRIFKYKNNYSLMI